MNKSSVLMFDAYFPPPVIGGKEKQVFLLAKSLIGEMEQIEVVTRKFKLGCDYQIDGLKVKSLPKGFFVIHLLIFLLKNRRKFRILHIHTPSLSGVLVAFLGRIVGFKIVFKLPNQGLFRNGWKNKFQLEILKFSVDRFIALEASSYDRFKNLFDNSNKVKLLDNGVEMGERIWRPRSERRDFLKIVCIARLVPQKNINGLLDACSVLRQKNCNFQLDIIGDGPCCNSLVSRSQDLKLENNVSFHGHHENTFNFLRECDIVVVPSFKEGMSNVILEAMAIGAPVLASDVGAAKHQVGVYWSEVLFDPKSTYQIASKLLEFDDLAISQVDSYSRYLHERALNLFDVKIVSGQYLGLYSELCSEC